MKRWAVAVSMALVIGACTDAASDGAATTIAESSSPPSSTSTTATTWPATTTTAETSRTDPGLGIAKAGYVLRALGDVQSVAPDGRVMVVAGGEQLCIQKLDVVDVECLASPPEFRSHPHLVGGWAPDGTTYVFHDRSATAVSFRSTVWVLDTAEPALEVLLDDPDVIVFDIAVSPQGDVVAFRGNVAGRTGVFTLSNGDDLDPVAETALGDNLAWLPDGTGLLFDALGDEGGLWRIDVSGAATAMRAEVDGRPSLASVSSDGSWALVYDREPAAASSVGQAYYRIVHLGTGEVSLLEVGSGGDFLGPVFAVFSPDGSRVAYLYHDGASGDAPLVLAIRPIGGGDEQIIIRDIFDAAGPPPSPERLLQLDLERGAVWTVDDRLVFPAAGWVLVIDME